MSGRLLHDTGTCSIEIDEAGALSSLKLVKPKPLTVTYQ